MTYVLRKFTIFGAILVLLGTLFAVPVAAQFDPLNSACEKASQQNSELCKPSGGTKDPLLGDGILAQAVNILSIVAAIIAVIIIIVSGIRLITSSGDPGAVATARNTIIYAAVGIVVVVISRTLVILFADRLG